MTRLAGKVSEMLTPVSVTLVLLLVSVTVNVLSVLMSDETGEKDLAADSACRTRVVAVAGALSEVSKVVSNWVEEIFAIALLTYSPAVAGKIA